MSAIDADLRLLIEIFAQVDALFTPLRCEKALDPLAAALAERRHDYFCRGGVPIVGGGAVRARQLHSESLRRLADAGAVTISGRTRLRVRLCPDVEARVRAMIGNSTLQDSWDIVERCSEFAKQGRTNCGFVWEVDLIGKQYAEVTYDDLESLEGIAMPALMRGWLDSSSDLQRRLGYAITAAGRKQVAAGCPQAPVDLPQYSSSAAEFYGACFEAALRARESWAPERPGHVSIPLSAGRWPKA